MKRKAFEDLPLALASTVLGCLDIQDACESRASCTKLRKTRPSWKKIEIRDPDDDKVREVVALCVPNHVNHLELHFKSFEITAAGLMEILRLRNLTKLLVSRCKKDFPVSMLQDFPHLRTLELLECVVEASALASLPLLKLTTFVFHPLASSLNMFRDIGQCLSLTRLDLCWVLDNDDLSRIATLANLEHLDLDGNQCFTDEGLAFITKLARLRVLRLDHCIFVTDAGLLHVARLAELENFQLHESRITSVQGLAGLANLKVLDLSFSDNLTDAGLACLPQLSKLEVLCLAHCKNITHAWIVHLKDLRVLNLKCTNVDDEGLLYISKIKSLTALSIGFHGVTQKGVEHLAALTNLQTLTTLL